MPWFTRGERTPRRGDLLESAIGPSTSLSGVVKSDGGLRIDGHFEGHIDVGGNVVVGEAGVVSVDVLIARNITVGGLVKGNIECSGRLEILSTGQVIGDILADAIMIDQGGVFQGSSRMRSAMPALPAPAAASPAADGSLAATVAGATFAGSTGGSGDPSMATLDDVIIDLGLSVPSVLPEPSQPLITPVAEAVRAADAADGPKAAVATATPPKTPPQTPPKTAPKAPPTSRRAEPELEFALDIEPVIPDTDGGSASGAVRQPSAAPALSDRGPQRNRRPGGGRRR